MSFSYSEHGSGVVVAGRTHVLAYPRRHPFDESEPIFLYLNGADGTPFGSWHVYGSILQELAALRPVIVGATADDEEWANDAYFQRVDEQIAYARSRMACHPTDVVVIGGSMGGHGALEWSRQTTNNVLAVGILIPAFDPNAAAAAAGLTTALELSWPEGVPASRDPSAHPEAFSDLPVYCWYSDDDPYIDASGLVAFCAAAGIESESLGAQAHGIGGLTGTQVVSRLGALQRAS